VCRQWRERKCGRMRRHTVFCLMAVGWLLAGCNRPMVALKAPALQIQEDTVRDWNDVAQAIASGLAANGLLSKVEQPTPSGMPVPVFVHVRTPDSTFVRAVADALQGDILAAGGIVARTPEGATVVNLDVTLVARGPLNTEAVWQARVVADDRVVMQLAEPVYVRDWDVPLYADVASLAPLPSWGTANPFPVRRVRYDP
jgi:hypothetical protein